MRRLVIIPAAIILAMVAGGQAALSYWRSLPAAQVPAIAAEDPMVRLRATDTLGPVPQKLRQQSAEITASARAVLRRAPLNALAMRQLGSIAMLQAAGGGDSQIALAEQITRRDLPSELMLINSADAQGDVATALQHYDHALSAYPWIREQLLPILASELSDPEVRRALQPYAAKPWLRDFVVHVASYDVTPRSLMEFYADLAGKVPVADMQEGTIRMIGWLAANQMSATLGTLVNRMPGVPPGAFDPLGFDAVTSDSRFKPLAWDLVNASAIANQGGANSLSVEVPPESAAVMASRMLFLAPGQYEVRQTINYDEGVPRARLTWLVACLGEVRSLLANEALPFANASNPHVMLINVPQGCGAQTWQLRASADQSQFASVARIDGLGLTRQ